MKHSHANLANVSADRSFVMVRKIVTMDQTNQMDAVLCLRHQRTYRLQSPVLTTSNAILGQEKQLINTRNYPLSALQVSRANMEGSRLQYAPVLGGYLLCHRVKVRIYILMDSTQGRMKNSLVS